MSVEEVFVPHQVVVRHQLHDLLVSGHLMISCKDYSGVILKLKIFITSHTIYKQYKSIKLDIIIYLCQLSQS